MKWALVRSRLSLLSIVALLVSVTLIGCSKSAPNPNGEGAARTTAVALVERKTVSNSLTLSGEFHPFQMVDVHSKVAGYIRRISVDVGDRVKAGQVLAVLEVPELNAQVQAAEATIKRAEGAVRRTGSDEDRAKSAHSAAHSAYTRLKEAAATRPGLIAEQELDDAMAKDQEAEAQVSSATAAFSEAQNQLSVAEAERRQLLALESYAQITAPFTGIITKRYADTGALIQAGTASSTQAMPVVQVSENSKLRLTVPVPESAVPLIHLGTVVAVDVPALHRTFMGKVARFADSLSDETRTMHTEIDVDNIDGTLVDGMYAETTIVLSKKDQVLTIPVEAIQRNGSAISVMTVTSDNQIAERPITLGMEGSTLVEVTSGLAEHDQVVIGKRSEFRPGDRVEPKLTAASAEKVQAQH